MPRKQTNVQQKQTVRSMDGCGGLTWPSTAQPRVGNRNWGCLDLQFLESLEDKYSKFKQKSVGLLSLHSGSMLRLSPPNKVSSCNFNMLVHCSRVQQVTVWRVESCGLTLGI